MLRVLFHSSIGTNKNKNTFQSALLLLKTQGCWNILIEMSDKLLFVSLNTRCTSFNFFTKTIYKWTQFTVYNIILLLLFSTAAYTCRADTIDSHDHLRLRPSGLLRLHASVCIVTPKILVYLAVNGEFEEHDFYSKLCNFIQNEFHDWLFNFFTASKFLLSEAAVLHMNFIFAVVILLSSSLHVSL